MSAIDYFDKQIDRIDSVASCEALAELKSEIESIFTGAIASVVESIAELAPIIEIPSADPGEIVAWITASVAPAIAAHNKLIALQVELLAKQAEALSALQDKFSELGCS